MGCGVYTDVCGCASVCVWVSDRERGPTNQNALFWPNESDAAFASLPTSMPSLSLTLTAQSRWMAEVDQLHLDVLDLSACG